MNLRFKNSVGLWKEVHPITFSWTVLFCGFFVPLLRGDWKYTLIMLLLSPLNFVFYMANIILAFKYNKLYVKGLLEKGYVPADEPTKIHLQQKGIFFNRK